MSDGYTTAFVDLGWDGPKIGLEYEGAHHQTERGVRPVSLSANLGIPPSRRVRAMKSRAAIVRDMGGAWSVEDFELDSPRAGEVLVQMAAAGLCHSDDHIRNGFMSPPGGPRTRPPTIGGHEGSGIVVEVGPGVAELAAGDHVVTSFVAVCGHCRWCACGMEYLCDKGAGVLIPGMPTDGTFRHHTLDGQDVGHTSKIGAFAEHTVVASDSLVKIDQDIPLVPAALLACAIPTGYGSSVHRGNVRGGDTAVWACDAVDLVRDLTRGVMADCVVVAPSDITGDDVRDALALTRKGGTCVLTGMAPAGRLPVQLDIQDLVLMNKTLCGTVFGSCNPRSEIPLLARMYTAGQLQLDEMITRRYHLDDMNTAFDDLLRGELVRGVIDFGIA